MRANIPTPPASILLSASYGELVRISTNLIQDKSLSIEKRAKENVRRSACSYCSRLSLVSINVTLYNLLVSREGGP